MRARCPQARPMVLRRSNLASTVRVSLALIKSSLGCLIEAWCFAKGIDFTPVGSWTLENETAQRGVEPDECYCLRENASREAPDRPDLAIEVIHTSGGISKLDVYRKLAVPEVWIWKGGDNDPRAPRRVLRSRSRQRAAPRHRPRRVAVVLPDSSGEPRRQGVPASAPREWRRRARLARVRTPRASEPGKRGGRGVEPLGRDA